MRTNDLKLVIFALAGPRGVMFLYRGTDGSLTEISGGYTHLGFGALRWVNGLGLVKLRFRVTLEDAVTQ